MKNKALREARQILRELGDGETDSGDGSTDYHEMIEQLGFSLDAGDLQGARTLLSQIGDVVETMESTIEANADLLPHSTVANAEGKSRKAIPPGSEPLFPGLNLFIKKGR